MKKRKTTNITSSFYISPQILKKKNGLTFTYSEWQHKRMVIYDDCFPEIYNAKLKLRL